MSIRVESSLFETCWLGTNYPDAHIYDKDGDGLLGGSELAKFASSEGMTGSKFCNMLGGSYDAIQTTKVKSSYDKGTTGYDDDISHWNSLSQSEQEMYTDAAMAGPVGTSVTVGGATAPSQDDVIEAPAVQYADEIVKSTEGTQPYKKLGYSHPSELNLSNFTSSEQTRITDVFNRADRVVGTAGDCMKKVKSVIKKEVADLPSKLPLLESYKAITGDGDCSDGIGLITKTPEILKQAVSDTKSPMASLSSLMGGVVPGAVTSTENVRSCVCHGSSDPMGDTTQALCEANGGEWRCQDIGGSPLSVPSLGNVSSNITSFATSNTTSFISSQPDDDTTTADGTPPVEGSNMVESCVCHGSTLLAPTKSECVADGGEWRCELVNVDQVPGIVSLPNFGFAPSDLGIGMSSVPTFDGNSPIESCVCHGSSDPMGDTTQALCEANGGEWRCRVVEVAPLNMSITDVDLMETALNSLEDACGVVDKVMAIKNVADTFVEKARATLANLAGLAQLSSFSDSDCGTSSGILNPDALKSLNAFNLSQITTNLPPGTKSCVCHGSTLLAPTEQECLEDGGEWRCEIIGDVTEAADVPVTPTPTLFSVPTTIPSSTVSGVPSTSLFNAVKMPVNVDVPTNVSSLGGLSVDGIPGTLHGTMTDKIGSLSNPLNNTSVQSLDSLTGLGSSVGVSLPSFSFNGARPGLWTKADGTKMTAQEIKAAQEEYT